VQTMKHERQVDVCKRGKGIVHPTTGHEGPKREQRYSSTLSFTSALGAGGQRHSAAAPKHDTCHKNTEFITKGSTWNSVIQ
jgi:hypothetical protein